jgi:hypothetical protein
MPLQQPIRAQRVDDRPDDHFMGIPNRDLTEEDWRALDADQQRVVADSGLWKVKTDQQMQPAVDRAERQAERAAATAERAADKEVQG